MYNKMILMGRIARDVELKASQNGIKFCAFPVACERRFQHRGEQRRADFFNVKCWGQTAEFVSKYFDKGSMIFVEGEMQTSAYTDKDGVQRTWYEVVAERVSFTGERSAPDSGGQSPTTDEPGSQRSASYGESTTVYPF